MSELQVAAQLAEQEQVIERGLQTFVDIGNALAKIRDDRLYRESYSTFEVYCQKRWNFTRDEGYKLIAAAGVVNDLVYHGIQNDLPKTERQARELVPLRDNPDAMRNAWQRAQEKAQDRGSKRPTARDVAEARLEQQAPSAPEPPPTERERRWQEEMAKPFAERVQDPDGIPLPVIDVDEPDLEKQRIVNKLGAALNEPRVIVSTELDVGNLTGSQREFLAERAHALRPLLDWLEALPSHGSSDLDEEWRDIQSR
jgi:hypothetical protein